MISDKSEKGDLIIDLPPKSSKKVKRVCDFCGTEKIMAYRDINKQRDNYKRVYGIIKDRCHTCQIKDLVKDRFKKPKKINRYTNGYIHIIDPKTNMAKPQHRFLIEESIGRVLTSEEVVHHIDGNKHNNDLRNLSLLPSESAHQRVHREIEKVAFLSVSKGIIKYDKQNFFYYLNPNKVVVEQSIDFDSISFRQKKNICESRLDVDTSSEIFRGFKVQIPLIASNMSTVINPQFLKQIIKLGGFGFLHRALNETDYLFQVSELAKQLEHVPVSIGIGDSQYQLACSLISHGANILIIDIAHGYCDGVINLGRKLKKEFPHIKIIVGNTTNVDMMYEVDDFADAVKIGIAQGAACETKNTAGCTEKQFSVCLNFKEVSKKLGLPVISDGGTREPADVVKAIAAGANSVMAGSIFAACPESASPIVDGKKLYAGMASEYVQNEWKGGLKPGTCSEGGIRYLEIGLPVEKLLERYQGALRTGATYSGAKDIKSLQDNVEWIYLK